MDENVVSLQLFLCNGNAPGGQHLCCYGLFHEIGEIWTEGILGMERDLLEGLSPRRGLHGVSGQTEAVTQPPLRVR